MGERAPRPSSDRVVGAIVLQGVLLTFAGIGLWMASGRPVDSMIRINGPEFAQGLGMAGIMIAAAWLIFQGFPRLSELLVRLQSEIGTLLGPLRWPGIVALSLSAGISEEVLLRAGLQTLLSDHLGIAAAVLISSALFAALHYAKPLITVLLFVIGMVFGLVYWLTDSLLTVIIAHAVYDVWALRYLIAEMTRLGLIDAAHDGAASLANPPQPG